MLDADDDSNFDDAVHRALNFDHAQIDLFYRTLKVGFQEPMWIPTRQEIPAERILQALLKRLTAD
jgi:hypothetical protein